MRILFTTHPGYGHLHPLVPTGRACQARGHEVAVATAASLCPAVEKLGFTAFPAGLDYLESDLEAAFPETRRLTLPELDDFIVRRIMWDRALIPMVRDLLTIGRDWKPDVIVRENTEAAGCLAAEVLRIPHAAQTVLGFHLRAEDIQDAARETLDNLRVENGLPADPSLKMLYRYLLLVAQPRAWVARPKELPPTTHWLQPPVFDRSGDEELPGWVATLPELPTVCMSLGTVYAYIGESLYRRAIEGLGGEPLNFIVLVGRSQDPAIFGTPPANVRIERYVPHSLLMPHCDLIITHGGANTVMSTLSHGLPLVVLPLGGDQPNNAQRVLDLGVGLRVAGPGAIHALSGLPWADPSLVSPESIKAAAWTILGDPAYRAKARAIQADLLAMPGPAHAAQLLERLARTGQPLVDSD